VSRTPGASSITLAGRAPRRVKLFISYTHKKKVWMERLAPLFDGIQYDDRLNDRSRLKYLHAWHEKELTAGNQWDSEIKRELDEMDIFVPLVSFEFLGSPYIQNVELKRAKERCAAGEILVVPIMLYDVNLRETCAFLHGFKLLPATDRSWSSYPDRSNAHRLIYEGLWEAIDEALDRKVMRKS
jgi:TIR domain